MDTHLRLKNLLKRMEDGIPQCCDDCAAAVNVGNPTDIETVKKAIASFHWPDSMLTEARSWRR